MILGLLIIIIGLTFKGSKWFQSMASYSSSRNGQIRFDIKKTANLFLFVCLYTGLIIILGDILSIWLETKPVFYTSFGLAIISGLGYFILKVNSVEYKPE